MHVASAVTEVDREEEEKEEDIIQSAGYRLVLFLGHYWKQFDFL